MIICKNPRVIFGCSFRNGFPEQIYLPDSEHCFLCIYDLGLGDKSVTGEVSSSFALSASFQEYYIELEHLKFPTRPALLLANGDHWSQFNQQSCFAIKPHWESNLWDKKYYLFRQDCRVQAKEHFLKKSSYFNLWAQVGNVELRPRSPRHPITSSQKDRHVTCMALMDHEEASRALSREFG
ncbi:hypothetical protein TNCV_394231 [Trichonephila clavipes]|nr:hypothetical protein TNCV_394231 [Trichonephila clavipes]